MQIAKSKFKGSVKSLMLLQTQFRKTVCRRIYQKKRNLVITLQSLYRMLKFKKYYRKLKSAVLCVKRNLLNKMILRIRYKRLQRSVNMFQQVVRGFLYRQQVNCVLRAVLMLQSFSKKFLRRNKAFYFRQQSVCNIQRVSRGHLCR
jgi:hypothetical protein